VVALGSSRRVLIVLHEDELGGASRSVLNVAHLLRERGWEAVFWTPAPGPLHDLVREAGWWAEGAPRLVRYSLGALREPPGAARRVVTVIPYLARFRAFLRRVRPALVHANTVLTLPEAAVARGSGYRTVLHLHETLGDGRRDRLAARLAHRGAHLTIAVSAAVARVPLAAGADVHVVFNGVAPAPMGPATADRRAGGLVVGTLGTVSRRKGSDVFVDAASRIREAVPGVELRLVGPLASGPERGWAEQQVRRAVSQGLRHAIVTDVFRELAEWDVFVMPSREDPFPLAVLEAMASGLPVVATTAGGLPEQLTAETGRLVPPGDVEALAGAVVELLGASRLRERMGAAARERVATEFTLESQADGIARVYDAALRRTGTAP
jgi:glycosyltransferase involved in cell wall biosynthesis